MTSELEEDLEVNWANTRMRQVLLNDVGYTYANARLKSNYCPKCTKHRMVHDDNACNMRYVVAVYSNLESAEVFVKSSTEKITDNYEKQRHGFDITEYEVEGRESNATGRNNSQRSSIDVP